MAALEIGKVLHYTFKGDYSAPEEYWFVTHAGVTFDLQDLLDNPDALRTYILAEWDQRCATKIIKGTVPLHDAMKAHIGSFDFSIFRAKQPLELIKEHQKTRYHLTVFDAPLIDRPPPAMPLSRRRWRSGICATAFLAIGEAVGKAVTDRSEFAHLPVHAKLFDRSRVTFYCAENLKELARDQMADVAFFETVLNEFSDGLFHDYSALGLTGLQCLSATVKAAQQLQLGGHVLAPHVLANDREGMCHQLANEERVSWYRP